MCTVRARKTQSRNKKSDYSSDIQEKLVDDVIAVFKDDEAELYNSGDVKAKRAFRTVVNKLVNLFTNTKFHPNTVHNFV